MRCIWASLGLIVIGAGPALALQDTSPAPQIRKTDPRPGIEEWGSSIDLDAVGEAGPWRSFTDTAMARASAAYMRGDFSGALIHAEQAAAGGEARGAALAGHIRLHGLAGAPDDAVAISWLRRAAELGETDALIILSRLALEERGGLSAWQARTFLARAAESGDARAAHEFGLYLMEQGDPGVAEEALNWLQLAAESGRTEAFGDYAQALGDWVHGPRDIVAARHWYARAGETGDPGAALIAGVMMMQGEGGGVNQAEGARLIQIAAEYRLPAAMGQYALLLFQGAGGRPANPAEAVDWARQGARANDPDSQFLLAYALAAGDGAPRNLERAYYWVLRAGAPRAGRNVEDSDRDRLQAALEQALPSASRDRLRLAAAADGGLF